MFKKTIIDDISKTVEKNKSLKKSDVQDDFGLKVNEHMFRKPSFNIGRIITYLILLVILLIVMIILFV